MKNVLCSAVGAIGSAIVYLLGGWDLMIQTLIIFMAVDYGTGLLVAGVFHKSSKTDTGALKSSVGWKGLCRKGMTLVIVIVATQLDKMTGTEVIRNAVIIGYVCNEAISIIENAGLMGLPVPAVIRDAIDLLKKKGENNK